MESKTCKRGLGVCLSGGGFKSILLSYWSSSANGRVRYILLKNSVNRSSSGFSSHQRLGECVALDFIPRKTI